jgi:hypothetical protein
MLTLTGHQTPIHYLSSFFLRSAQPSFSPVPGPGWSLWFYPRRTEVWNSGSTHPVGSSLPNRRLQRPNQNSVFTLVPATFIASVPAGPIPPLQPNRRHRICHRCHGFGPSCTNNLPHRSVPVHLRILLSRAEVVGQGRNRSTSPTIWQPQSCG